MKNPSYPHPIIAREGWPIIGVSLLIAILASCFLPWIAIIFWLFFIFAVQFFRDPVRTAPSDDDLVLSPADGRIVCVEEAEDPYYENRKALKISVFMNVFNVHSNRSPVAGKVKSIAYYPGKFFNASLDKASLENERNAMVIKTKDDHIVTAVQIAGLVAKRIICYAKPSQKLYAGQRYGFIRFGSRVDLYLPLESKPKVAIGDKVKATSTALAELPDED